MKTIKEAAVELSKNEVKSITDDYSDDLKVCIEFGFENGAKFAQRWIKFKDELPEKGIEIVAKKPTKRGEVKAIFTPLTNSDIKHLCENYTHWRPIELK